MGDKKRRFITTPNLRGDSPLRDRFLPSPSRTRRPRDACCACCSGEAACYRYVKFCKFCCVVTGSLFFVVGPFVLATMEVLAVLLIYFLGTSKSVVIHEPPSQYHFSYTHSLEDVVGISVARALLLSMAHGWGMHRVHSLGCMAHRPYLYSSYALAAACFPYVLVKALLYRYGTNTDAIAAAAIFGIVGAFAWFHVLAARRLVEWTRRNYQMGLAGFGYNWDEGDADTWTLIRRPDPVVWEDSAAKAGGAEAGQAGLAGLHSGGIAVGFGRGSYGATGGGAGLSLGGFGASGGGAGLGLDGALGGQGAGGLGMASGDDVPPESLADEDSRFLYVHGIKVHYKEALPSSWRGQYSPPHFSNYASQAAQCAHASSQGEGAAGANAAAAAARAEADGSAASTSAGASCLGSGNAAVQHEEDGGTAVLLVHGYGAGVFAWRHIMQPLAEQCQCRVLAFDRPAFGLTSRPPATTSAAPAGTSHQRTHFLAGLAALNGASSSAGSALGSSARNPGNPGNPGNPSGGCLNSGNPYALGSQAGLLLQLCAQLGVKRVLLVAHSDGCLVALTAATAAYTAAAAAAADTAAPPAPLSQPGQERDLGLSLSPEQEVPGGLPVQSNMNCIPGESQGVTGGSPVKGSGGNAGAAGARQLTGEGGSGRLMDIEEGSASGAGRASVPGSELTLEGEGQLQGTGEDIAYTAWRQAGVMPGRGADLDAGGVGGVGPSYSPHTSVGSGVGLRNSASTGGGGRGGGVGTWAGVTYSFWSAAIAARRMPTVSTSAAPTPGVAQRRARHRRVASAPGVGDESLDGNLVGTSDEHTGHEGAGGSRGQLGYTAGSRLPVRPGAAAAGYPAASCCSDAAGSVGGSGAAWGAALPWPEVLGLALLHPNLTGHAGPGLSRLLSQSGFGRSVLRPLLRSEVGEVALRRAWYRPDRLTPDVLELYKAPLRVQGWDDALLETARLGREVSSAELERHLAVLAAAARPVLVVTAVHDSIVPPDKVERVWKCGVPHARLALLPECGHASHEEAPGLLLQQLAPFCALALAQAQPLAPEQDAQGQYQGRWQPQGRQQAHEPEICAA